MVRRRNIDEVVDQAIANMSSRDDRHMNKIFERDAMDLLFDIFDRMLMRGREDIVNELLKNLIVPETPELMVCILMTTLPASHVLPARAEYVAKVKSKLLQAVGEKRTQNILRGLE